MLMHIFDNILAMQYQRLCSMPSSKFDIISEVEHVDKAFVIWSCALLSRIKVDLPKIRNQDCACWGRAVMEDEKEVGNVTKNMSRTKNILMA